MAAEAIIAPLAKSVLSKIASFVGDVVGEELKSFKSVKDDLKNIAGDLECITAVLQDADAKQYSDAAMKIWLRDLKNVVYDIDDLLDEVATDALRREVNKGHFLPQLAYYLSFKPLVARFDLSHKIKKLQQQLNCVVAKRDRFGLTDRPVEAPSVERDVFDTCSYVDQLSIVGRDEAKNDVLNKISGLGDDCSLHVLPILGMGGIGKTAFAKLVYGAIDQFDIKLWVCVSEKFDMRKIINDILEKAIHENTSDYPLGESVEKLRQVLNGKRFFLVLDDLWEDDIRLWIELKSILAVDPRGSVILITTRVENVARVTKTVETFYLDKLSDSSCRCIFNKLAFADGEEEKYPRLCEIGLSIVGKCHGNPLAVRALGSLLRDERDEKEWLRITTMDNLNQLDGPYNLVKQFLKLSFDKLPSSLKPGFAHLSLFAKDSMYNTFHIAYCWSALGLSHLRDGTNFDQNIYKKLLTRSMLQDVEWDFDDTILEFKIHDLLHDLAEDVIGEELAVVTMSQLRVPDSSRYIIWGLSGLADMEFPDEVKAKNGRVFMFRHPIISVSKSFLKGIISNMPRLRVLGLEGSQFEELPSTIGNLKHLRVLDLSYNLLIKSLPETVCDLVNMECILLGWCIQLEELPLMIYKLIKLRYLWLTTQQRSLVGFNRFHSLEHLFLISCMGLESLWDNEDAGRLTSLRVLKIVLCHSLKRLPDSMKLLVNLEELAIFNCEELDLESGEGLSGFQVLRKLEINGIKSMTFLPIGFRSTASSLKYLSIRNCERLAELPDWLQTCTSLRGFWIHYCPNLLCLPQGICHLDCLQYLSIRNCWHLLLRCANPGGEDYALIQHIPKIDIPSISIYLSPLEIFLNYC